MAGSVLAVQLRDDEGKLEATFVPGTNMLCCSLRHRGEELLAQNAGVDAYAQRGKTMGIPLLYPWANRLAGFEYTVAGRTVSVPHDPLRIALDGNALPIHGVIGGFLAWELQAPESSTNSLAAHLSWNDAKPELFEVFPFQHELTYRARLAAGRLQVELTVHACGADVVPVAFGFHPYLCVAGAPREGWRIEFPSMRGLQLDATQIPLAAGEMFHAWCAVLGESAFDDGFEALAEPACFSASAGGRRVAFEFLQGYPCAQVYSPAGAQFVCFEPMTAPANSLRSGRGLRLLAPGERFSAAFALSVEDLAER
jgi:aldose 1-epimerase